MQDQSLKDAVLHSSKRRRATAEDGDGAPAPKKTYSEAEIAAELARGLQLREQRRAEVRAVYLNYGTLLKGSENGAEALAFQGLLDCANGSLGARRLAARLVPRFLPRFPSHLDQAYRLLIALYTGGSGGTSVSPSPSPASPPGPTPSGRDRRPDLERLPNGHGPCAHSEASPTAEGAADATTVTAGTGMTAAAAAGEGAASGGEAALLSAMRRDALLGLGNVLEGAVRQAERGVPLVAEIVAFLLRQLPHTGAVAAHTATTHDAVAAATTTAAPASASPSACKAEPGGAGRADCNGGAAAAATAAATAAGAAALLDPDPDSDAGVALGLLLRAFCLFPRIVLAACLQPHRLPPPQRPAEDRQAGEALLGLLLREAPSAAATVAAAGGHGGDDCGGHGAMVYDGAASTSSPGLACARGSPSAAHANGKAASGSASGGGRTCLAETVLTALPDTQAWLRQLTTGMTHGKAAAPLSPTLRTHLDRLAQFCTAAQLAAAAPAAGAVKASPKASPGNGGGGTAVTADGGGAHAPPPPPPPPLMTRHPEVKAEAGPAALVAPTHSLVGSEDNSRSVPMDLDHSISTAIKQEPGAAGAAGGGGGAAASGPADTAATGHADTAATSPPLPPPPPPPLLPSSSSAMAAAAAAAMSPGCGGGGGGLLRGGAVCRAEACLYVGGLPLGLSEAALAAELSRLGSVESVHAAGPLPHPGPPPHGAGASAASAAAAAAGLGEEAYVVFASLRDAAICYEAIARTCPFGGTRPLQVEFCSVFPPDSPAARRRTAAAAAAGGGSAAAAALASQFVWVSASAPPGAGGGGATAAPPGATPEAVVAALQEAALPVPQQILQVQGRAPGMLLHLAAATAVPQVVSCLQARFAPLPPPPPPLPPPPPVALAGGLMGPSAPTAAVAASPAAAPQPPLPPPPPPPLHGAQYGPPGGAPGKAAASLPYDAPPPNCRTLWVGQLHESVRDEELLSACRAAGGPLVGHRFLRGSHCAFVDFASQAGAEAAKRALHGLRMGPQHLRVEWKDSGMRGGPGGGRHGGMHPAPIGAGIGIGDAGPSPLGPLAGPGREAPGAAAANPSAGAMRHGVGTPCQQPASVPGSAPSGRGSHGGGQRAGADRWAPAAVPPLPPAPPVPAAGGGAAGTPAQAAAAAASAAAAAGPGMMRMGGFPADMSPAVAAAVRQAPVLLPQHQQPHPHGHSHSHAHPHGHPHGHPSPGVVPPLPPPPPHGGAFLHGHTQLHPHSHTMSAAAGGGMGTPAGPGLMPPAPQPLPYAAGPMQAAHAHAHAHLSPHAPLQAGSACPPGQLAPALSLQRFDSGPPGAAAAAGGGGMGMPQPHSTSPPRPPDGGGAAGPGAPPPPPLPHARAQAAAAAAQAAVTWQGGLAKSGSHMCTLRCTGGGASAASGASPGEREPVGWPAVLDVKLRVDLTYVVHSLYSHTAPHFRSMRRLVPCNASGGPPDPAAPPKLAEFLSYLTDKNRAGVIKLDASPAAGLPPRTLYLVPPSEQVCAALGAEWTPTEPFLLALVVPTAGGG